MSFSNRCPKCGSIANFFNLDNQGRKYYKCTRGLTSLKPRIGKNPNPDITVHIFPCDTILDEEGAVFTGIIGWFNDNNQPESIRVNAGKEVN